MCVVVRKLLLSMSLFITCVYRKLKLYVVQNNALNLVRLGTETAESHRN